MRRRGLESGERRADFECASLAMIAREGRRRSGEEEIDIVASDLRIELNGSIDKGVGLAILGGDLTAIACGKGNLSELVWSGAMDD